MSAEFTSLGREYAAAQWQRAPEVTSEAAVVPKAVMQPPHTPHEVSTAIPEVPVPIAVSYRQVGAVTVKGVLAAHGMRHTTAIAKELNEATIIALEGPLSNTYRSIREKQYSDAVTNPYRYENLNTLRDPSGANELFGILRGLTNERGPKDIRLIDIDPDADCWAAHKQTERYAAEYQTGMQRIPPLAAALRARTKLTDVLAVNSMDREAYMQRAAEAVIAEAGQRRSPSMVGIALGLGHLPLLQRIGSPVGHQADAQLTEQIAYHAAPGTQAALAHRAGRDPMPYIKRAVLGDYAQAVRTVASPQLTATLRSLHTMPPDAIEAGLAAIDGALRQTSQYLFERQERVANALATLYR